jgi:hypothetical protein
MVRLLTEGLSWCNKAVAEQLTFTDRFAFWPFLAIVYARNAVFRINSGSDRISLTPG